MINFCFLAVLRVCSTELLPLVRSSRQRALASSAVLKYGCRQPLVHRSSMLLATSSQTPAESRSSCLMKLSTRGCLRSFVTSKCTSCCNIDLDQMSARYLSVYFHNVTGESGRVFMRRSKPSIRSPRRQRQNSAGSRGPPVRRPASDFRAPATWCYPSNVCLGVMASFSHAMTWEVVHVAA